MKIDTFEIGDNGEQFIFKYLCNKFGTNNIMDVTKDYRFRNIDVDFILKNNENIYFLELKTDSKMHQTKNIFFEIGHDRKTGYYDGWFKYSMADFIINLDSFTNEIWIVTFDKEKIKEISREIKFWNNIDECYTYGYLLNQEIGIKNGIVIKDKIYKEL